MSERELLKGLSPVLAVDNLSATLDWYAEQLGFIAKFTWGDPAYYGIVQRDRVAIHLSEREDTSKPIQPATIYVFVTNVDDLYREYERRDLDIFQPPQDMEYGMREFDLRDINGHYITFGQDLGT